MAPRLLLGLFWLCRCGALRSSLQSRLEDLWDLMQQMELQERNSLFDFCKDMACLDHGCHKEVSISVEDLAKFPLVPPPPEQDYVKDPEGAEEERETSALQTYVDPKFASDGYEVREKNKENFLEGAGVATRYLEVATNFFQAHGLYPGRVDVIFRQWFKSDTVPVKRMVADHLGNILQVLQNLRVHGDRVGESIECNESSAAYVSTYCDTNVSAMPFVSEEPCGEHYPEPFELNGRFVVHICPSTWKQDVIFHAGNLVHESSHHFGTVDFAYGMTGCMALDQNKALSNADTYIYFLQHLYAMIRDEAWSSYRGLTSRDRGVHKSKYALPAKKPQPTSDLSFREFMDIFTR